MLQTFLSKKNILKILIIIIFVGTTISAFSLSDYFSKSYGKEDEEIREVKNDSSPNEEDPKTESSDTNLDDGLVSVSMKLIDKNGNVIFDEIRRANDEEVLYDVLVKYHDVRAEKSTYGMVLFDIDSVKTKFYSESYISILVNNKYSSFGVSSIYVYDGIKVTFKEVAL